MRSDGHDERRTGRQLRKDGRSMMTSASEQDPGALAELARLSGRPEEKPTSPMEDLEGRRVIRVFPRLTEATPTDRLAVVGDPQLWSEADEVRISVTFSWDLPEAERLEREWRQVTSNVRIGGPATGEHPGEFVPGMYLADGYVMTSRGCPGRCPHCVVPEREGRLVELPIRDGWDVVDNNLLACSKEHIHAVFGMLHRMKRNRKKRARFTGGLDARILREWHAKMLRTLRPEVMYFAYDSKSDYEPLVEAGKLMRSVGYQWCSSVLGCYVLIGYNGDTFDAATYRLNRCIDAGFRPYAMLYMDPRETRPPNQVWSREWRQFRSEWLIPKIVSAKVRARRALLGVADDRWKA